MTDRNLRSDARAHRAAANRILSPRTHRPTRSGALILTAACALVPAASSLAAQSPALTTVAPFTRPHLAEIPVLTQPVKPGKPLTITGARGAILGEQSGVVELWQLPVKVFSNLHLRAEIDGYTVPLELNPAAATVEVRPGHTVLTYSLAGITVRQHMLVSPARNVPSLEENPDTPVHLNHETPGAPTSPRPTRATNQRELQSAVKVGSNQHELNKGAVGPDHEPTLEDPGALLYFEIDSIRPATLTVTLTPAMQQMWPAPQYGIPGSGWQPMGGGGAYTIATDNPALFGMVGMPNSKPGHLPVYQEHPQTLPLEFLVRYDPAKDKGRLYPLLSTVSKPGETNNAASQQAMQQRLADQAANLPALTEAIDTYYAHFFDTRLTVHTPDPNFDEALRWAELSIEDSQVEHLTGPAGNQKSETGLVAGWFPSYDSTRPGFGWYFGRDTLWSLYAIDSYGDTALAKRALEFLLHRQRADGKMMHEFSQMADDLPANMAWSTFGYEYAAADATPLFLLALCDYVRTSGDTQFLADHWEQARRAYTFERTHDTDGDGVYDNAQGTGWVENWQSPMPHQELYLASLDQQATQAMADLATLQHDDALATAARATAAKLTAAVEQYRDPATNLYAFSKNPDGTYDRTLTIYPAVTLWNSPTANASITSESNPGALSSPRRTKAASHPEPQSAVKVGSAPTNSTEHPTNQSAPCPDARLWVQPTPQEAPCTYGLQHPEAMLQSWSSPLMATDWGTRALATTVPFYDPISYHMGSVWPLFTGWNAMAQYRTDHPAAAWLTLQQNLRLTFAEDPGTVTEVLSGQFYQPMGRSSAHQLWSSAMTLAPALRGLFGIDVDTTTHTLSIHPHLPVTWNEAALDNVRMGPDLFHVQITRNGKALEIVRFPMQTGRTHVVSSGKLTAIPGKTKSTLPLPAVEFSLHDPAAPQPGDETRLPHLTAEQYFPDRTEFDLEAEANTTVLLDVRRNGTLDPKPYPVTLPNGKGYVTKHVILSARP